MVFKCQDTVLKRIVAIKTLSPGAVEKDIVQFQKEARAIGNLKHSNILDILDFGISKSQEPYLIMEFLDGFSLQEILKNGPLEPVKALYVVIQVLNGINHAHSKGVIHRDLKPSNIILSEKSKEKKINVKVIDFGIAHMPKSGDDGFDSSKQRIVGSPSYISPEVAKGDGAVFQSDIYSIGCVLFECLTGRPPFTAESSIEIIQAHIGLAPPELKDYLENSSNLLNETSVIIKRCLEKNPLDRFKSAKELSQALSNLLKIHDEEQKYTFEEESGKWHFHPKKKVSGRQIIAISSFIFLSLFVIFIFNKNTEKIRTSLAEKHTIKPMESKNQFSKKLDTVSTGLLGGSGNETDKELIEGTAQGFKTGKFILSNNPRVTDKGIMALRGKQVKNLEIAYTSVTDRGLSYLSEHPELVMLKLDGLQKISERGLQKIPRNKNLIILNLTATQLTDKELEVIAKIKSLKVLSLSG